MNFNFFDGGAFAEIHTPQYPLGMGMAGASAPPRSAEAAGSLVLHNAAKSYASKGLQVGFVQTPQSALEEKHYTAEELQRPSKAEVDAGAQRTRDELEAALAKRQAELQKSPSSDLLNPVGAVVVKKQAVKPSTDGGGAIIRSPTKREAAAAALPDVPPCIRSKNPRGHLISIETRQVMDGRQLDSTSINVSHLELAETLLQARKELSADAKQRKDAREHQNEVLQDDSEKRLAEEAATALQRRKEEGRKRARTETPQEREERIRAEREEREREHEERRKQRRLDKTARLLGMTAEEMAEDVELQQKIIDAEAVVGSEESALPQSAPKSDESGVTFDRPLFSDASAVQAKLAKSRASDVPDLFGLQEVLRGQAKT